MVNFTSCAVEKPEIGETLSNEDSPVRVEGFVNVGSPRLRTTLELLINGNIFATRDIGFFRTNNPNPFFIESPAINMNPDQNPFLEFGRNNIQVRIRDAPSPDTTNCGNLNISRPDSGGGNGRRGDIILQSCELVSP